MSSQEEDKDDWEEMTQISQMQMYDDVSEYDDSKSVVTHRTKAEEFDIPPDVDLDQIITQLVESKNKRLQKKLELKHEQKLQ